MPENRIRLKPVKEVTKHATVTIWNKSFLCQSQCE